MQDVPNQEESSEEYICTREQCGYHGPAPKDDTTTSDKVLGGACGTLACGPWIAIFFGIIGLLIAIASGSIAFLWIGLVIGIIVAIVMFSTNTSQSLCPACKQGMLESVNSERGQALVKRIRDKHDSA